jgi:tetratricopeptide (TPR) repeat protein
VTVKPNASSYSRRAILRANAGDRPGALNDRLRADALRASSDDPSVLDVVDLTATGAAANTLPIIDALVAKYPGAPCLHYLRGDALNALKRFDEALAAYDRSLVRDAVNRAAEHRRAGRMDLATAERTNRARPFAMRGQIRLDRGDLNGAYEDFENPIAAGVDDPGAYYGRGFIKVERGDLDGGIRDLEKAEALAPGLYAHLLAKARELKVAKEREELERQRAIQEALARNPRTEQWRQCADAAVREISAMDARGFSFGTASNAEIDAYGAAAGRGLRCLQDWVRAADAGQVSQPPSEVDELGRQLADLVEMARDFPRR